MVDSKKKTPVKKTVKKTANTKPKNSTTTSKKTVVKKDNKVTKKANTSKAKNTSKKKTGAKKQVSEKHVTDNIVTENKSNKSNKTIITILIVAILIFALLIGYLLMNNKENSNMGNNGMGMDSSCNGDDTCTPEQSNMINTNNNNNITTGTQDITLTILEDPTCTACQVDVFAAQVKKNLISNLKVKKISIESNEGKAILAAGKINQVPVYFFSENIDKRADWAEKLAGAFVRVQLGNSPVYMLNPQFVPNKVMIEEPKILDGAVVYGNVTASVTIYEFSDYECPFCAISEGNKELVTQFQASQPGYVPAMPSLYKEYINTGKVKLVFYNMPLEQLHPKVMPAHVAALCANEQGHWIDFHHKLFNDRADWSKSVNFTAKMKEYAATLGLNTDKFDTCISSGKFDTQIKRELAYGTSLGVSGTPAFFVGKNFLSGAQNYSTFKTLIDEQLAASK